MTANISNTVTIIAPMVVNIVKKFSDIVHGLQTRWFCYSTLRNVGLVGEKSFCFKFGWGTHSGESGTGTDPSTRSIPAVAPLGKPALFLVLEPPELLALFQCNLNSFTLSGAWGAVQFPQSQ